MQMKTKISIVCKNCGNINSIPTQYFYDGCEGPFLCKFCGDALEIDTDYE